MVPNKKRKDEEELLTVTRKSAGGLILTLTPAGTPTILIDGFSNFRLSQQHVRQSAVTAGCSCYSILKIVIAASR